jgi:DNA-binding MarR family transcriptional regulator
VQDDETGEGASRPSLEVHPTTALLRDILDLTTEFERHLGRELAVNPTDLEAMEHLIRDGSLSPTELARRLGITTAAVTTVVDRRVGAGHVTREPNPRDRRSILVAPDPRSAERAMATLLPMILGMDRVLHGFDEAEKAVITTYLTRVVDVYRAQLPSGP